MIGSRRLCVGTYVHYMDGRDPRTADTTPSMSDMKQGMTEGQQACDLICDLSFSGSVRRCVHLQAVAGVVPGRVGGPPNLQVLKMPYPSFSQVGLHRYEFTKTDGDISQKRGKKGSQDEGGWRVEGMFIQSAPNHRAENPTSSSGRRPEWPNALCSSAGRLETLESKEQ